MQKNLGKKAVVLAIILILGIAITPIVSANKMSLKNQLNIDLPKNISGRDNESDPPIANFSYEPIEPKTGEQIYFNSTSYDPDGFIINWTWDFDDGTIIYGENVTHTYQDNGSYTINLTVKDNNSINASIEKTIVLINQKPTADFTYMPENPSVDQAVFFADQSDDIDGEIVTWWWEFGDGYYSDLQNPTHYFGGIGNFTVKLTVTDDDGDIDFVEVIVFVLDENEAPNAPTITGSDIVKAEEEVNYLFQSEDPDGDDVKFVVTWGDSTSTETEFNPSNEPVLVSHVWNITLPIPIMILRMTVKAVDEHGAESILIEKWVIVTSFKSVNYDDPEYNQQRPIISLISKILNRFPNAFPIVKLLVHRLAQ